VRDYIHVADLATAHLNALDYLRAGGDSLTANVGYGHGYSVREVLSSVEKIAGIRLDIREEPRRAGDPPSLVARCDRVRDVLKWQPRLDDIDTIVRTSLEWEKRLQRDPW
jgi:UDP-glucose 4-epimerase